jgi:ABC-type sugar transport system ATPase subunit
VLVGRWLIGAYKAIMLEEPTRGVDIGAKVGHLQGDQRPRPGGLPVLMYSSELLELIGMCDRWSSSAAARLVLSFLGRIDRGEDPRESADQLA